MTQSLALSGPSGVFTAAKPLTEAGYFALAARWREQYMNADHRVMVLPTECTITRRCCSYCRCEMTGIRCGNCGAPAMAVGQ